MFLGVGFHEVMILVVIIVVLLLTTRFGLLKRTCDRFLEEFRKALAGSQPQSSKKQTEQDADEICYQLLGITPSASQDEIREAYLKKAKQYHPDKGGDPDMMRALTEAYRKLSGGP